MMKRLVVRRSCCNCGWTAKTEISKPSSFWYAFSTLILRNKKQTTHTHTHRTRSMILQCNPGMYETDCLHLKCRERCNEHSSSSRLQDSGHSSQPSRRDEYRNIGESDFKTWGQTLSFTYGHVSEYVEICRKWAFTYRVVVNSCSSSVFLRVLFWVRNPSCTHSNDYSCDDSESWWED